MAADGLALAKKKNPDVILLDVMLPDATGFQTCGKYRQDAQTQHTPIIMMSGTARFTSQQAIGRMMQRQRLYPGSRSTLSRWAIRSKRSRKKKHQPRPRQSRPFHWKKLFTTMRQHTQTLHASKSLLWSRAVSDGIAGATGGKRSLLRLMVAAVTAVLAWGLAHWHYSFIF